MFPPLATLYPDIAYGMLRCADRCGVTIASPACTTDADRSRTRASQVSCTSGSARGGRNTCAVGRKRRLQVPVGVGGYGL
jgi:hypothetical protein